MTSDVAAKSKAPHTVRGYWSNDQEDYDLKEVIGYGATAVVQAAIYTPKNEKVAIKRIDLEKCGASLDEMQKEIQTMSQCHHENVVNYYTSFIVKQELWIVMKLLDGGSILDIIIHLIKGKMLDPLHGVLEEAVIATVLKEVLKGLEYFHKNGQIHRDVKAGNILLGSDGTVQLADFGVSSAIFDYSDRKCPKMRKTFVGTPCWMAPEVMEQLHGYDHKADIWSFGITAIELATGTAPYAKYPAMKVLMLTLQNDPPTLETCADGNKEAYKKYSKSFRKMIAACLRKDPAQRPDATEVLKLSFFKKAKGKDYLVSALLNLAPGLGERAQKVKRIPGSSGRLHRTSDGEWEWSEDDDDVVESRTQIAESSGKEVDSSTATDDSKFSNIGHHSPYDVNPHHAESCSRQHHSLPNVREDSRSEQLHAPSLSDKNSAGQTSYECQSDALSGTFVAHAVEESKIFDLTLRLRNSEKELNDIRFEFNTKSDTVDGVAQELMSAGLIDGHDLIVVAANLNKMIQGPVPESKHLIFALKSCNESSSELHDDKQLIGFAMLTLNN